ncbi:MAG: hypothetical protein IJY89_04515 [Clostridia bacterium]|nr:hypothetical protein [Clostridia bacterium]
MKTRTKKLAALLLAALLTLPLLSACNDPSYTGVIPPIGEGEQEQSETPKEDDGKETVVPTPEPTPSPTDDETPEPTIDPAQQMKDLLEELMKGDKEHLFGQKEYLKELFSGLSQDYKYLIADFEELLAQNGITIEGLDEKKFLFMLESGLDEEALAAVTKELENKKPLLEKLAKDEEGKEVVEYAIYVLDSDPTMKEIAVTFFDTTLGKQVVGVYKYVTAPADGTPILPPAEEVVTPDVEPKPELVEE